MDWVTLKRQKRESQSKKTLIPTNNRLCFQNNRMTQEKVSKQSLPSLESDKIRTGHVFQIESGCGQQYHQYWKKLTGK